MAVYKINSTGNVVEAEQPFMDASYPGNYTLVTPDQAAVSLGTKITPDAFEARIGDTTMQSIYTAAQTNTALEVFRDKMWNARYIDLTDPEVQAGLTLLVGLNILTAAEMTAILSAQVQQNELP